MMTILMLKKARLALTLLLLVQTPAYSQSGDLSAAFMPGNFFSSVSRKPSLIRPPVDPVMSDDVPTLDQVRLIPSLKGEQNKQISTMFELYRSEIKPMQAELKIARNALSDAKKARAKAIAAKTSASVDTTDVAYEQLQKAEDTIAQSIKDRRVRLMTELKAIVSEAQLAELQKIRHGELIEQ